jgi:hypothetical protein
LYADVSEHTVHSIFIGGVGRKVTPMKIEPCIPTHKIKTPGINQKKEYNGVFFVSRRLISYMEAERNLRCVCKIEASWKALSEHTISDGKGKAHPVTDHKGSEGK